MDKLKFRQSMRENLSLIDEVSIDRMSLLISKHLSQLLSKLNVIQQKIDVGAFAPIMKGGNIEPRIDLSFLEQDQVQTSYPSYDSIRGGMIFKRARKSELVKKKDFGPEILAPNDLAPELVPGVILLPGLGFSQKGDRLGRGKGFYDKYLETYRGIKIGVCFQCQLKDLIPREKHDVPVDYIVTEEKIIECKMHNL